MFGPAGDIMTGNGNAPGIGEKTTGYAVQQGRFSGTVRADNRNEITLINLQIDVIQGKNLIDTSLVKIFNNVI
jgi:hypothetical protein